MDMVRITLPNELTHEAEHAGLLSPERIEASLHEQLKIARVDELFGAMERIHRVQEPAAMSPEELAVEIAAMRAERRANGAR